MKRLKSIVLVALAVFVGVVYMLPAHPAAAQSSSSMSIPPKKNYVIEPGKSVKDTLVIRNLDGVQPLDLNLRVVDFTYTDDSGTPKLMLDPNAPQTTWSLKSDITLPEEVSIKPGETKTINMSVTMPANQGAGSYYSAIVYSSGSGSGGNVGLSASGVTLVFVNVPGQVKEDLKLQKLGAYDVTAKNYTFITGDEPQNIGYTLQNNGNVAESPVGSITLKDMFGHSQTIDNVNPNGSLALIGQSRTYTACIKLTTQQLNLAGTSTPSNTCTSPGLWPGLYTVSLDLFYGQNGNQTNEITGTATFWYLPLWFVIVTIIALLIVAFIVWRIVRWFREKFNGPRGAYHSRSRLSRRK
ncbi:MAG TPA: hypothetical protein VN081_00665 [Dongiaceae bacterium]|nr:hypothetical protein [Dongiaceae bacterium]